MPKGRNLCNHPARRFIGAPCPLSRAPPRCMKRAASRVAEGCAVRRRDTRYFRRHRTEYKPFSD
jgi:hypothetical protein